MSATETYRALVEEIERGFAPARLATLAHPLAELERALADHDQLAAQLDLIDLIEDLLESLLRESGWPDVS